MRSPVEVLILFLIATTGAFASEDALRPRFHFMPFKNWMNDPNGPMFYRGMYHLFFQYNPYAPVPGNITWGHAVSADMINWAFLDLALRNDKPYDSNGAFSGSITFVDGVPTILYTGSAAPTLDQSQNEAIPANISDPLVRKWKKLEVNPVIFPPPAGVRTVDFRDPTTAWKGQDGLWRVLVGAKTANATTGLALLYKSADFVNWTIVDHPLHQVNGTGMWECPDFYPVREDASRQGLQDSLRGPGTLQVLKVSLDNKRLDAYSVGRYDAGGEMFVPNVGTLDTGIGLLYDSGVFYASKTFFDNEKQRRVLWGWVTEKDSVQDDLAKGWAGLQALPRRVWLDEGNKNAIKQWPIEETNTLRTGDAYKKANIDLHPGDIKEMEGITGTQLDIQLSFNLSRHKLAQLNSTSENGTYYCNELSTMTYHGYLGPFGLLVLASEHREEETAIFFHLVSTSSGWKPLVCHDIRRSSLSSSVTKTIYGSFVNVTAGENHSLSLRVIVDRSVVEAFVQGGKACLTSRVYPTLAVNKSSRVLVFNNGTSSVELEHISIWKMRDATFQTLEPIT